jgi:ribonuclease D
MAITPFQVLEQDLTISLLEYYLQSGAIAVDTETMGLIPQRDRLCLVQICDAQEVVTCLRIARGQSAAPLLKQLLEANTVEKVFHFARFDLAALCSQLNIRVQPVFCTKIASKLARTYTSKHGLKDLVLELEQVDLDKRAQCSDWGNVMNLSAEQLAYAANDVRYLLPARHKLTQMLQREERWNLAQQCFTCLPTWVELDLLHYPNVFEH